MVELCLPDSGHVDNSNNRSQVFEAQESKRTPLANLRDEARLVKRPLDTNLIRTPSTEGINGLLDQQGHPRSSMTLAGDGIKPICFGIVTARDVGELEGVVKVQLYQRSSYDDSVSTRVVPVDLYVGTLTMSFITVTPFSHPGECYT